MPVNTSQSFYTHKQKSGRLLYLSEFFVLFGVVMTCFFLVMTKLPGGIFLFLIFAVVTVVFIWSALAISSLTVAIDNEYVRLVFGPHMFVKKFALKDITDAKPVKNDFWDGWGIHTCGDGFIYNIAGYDGVEITMVSGRHNRIGTDQPLELAEAIKKAVSGFSKKGI